MRFKLCMHHQHPSFHHPNPNPNPNPNPRQSSSRVQSQAGARSNHRPPLQRFFHTLPVAVPFLEGGFFFFSFPSLRSSLVSAGEEGSKDLPETEEVDAKEAVSEAITHLSVKVDAVSLKRMAEEGRNSKIMETGLGGKLKHRSLKDSGCYKWLPRPKDTTNKSASPLVEISHEIIIPVDSPIKATKKDPLLEALSQHGGIKEVAPSETIKTFREIPVSIVSSEEDPKEVSTQAMPQLSESEEFTASVKVDAKFLKFVIGKQRKTKKRIEKETTAKISVPTIHKVKHGSPIVIKGPSQEKVDEAVSKINAVLHEAEESSISGYSHFISLPLSLHPALKDHVTEFHDSVLSLVAAKKSQESVDHSDLCPNVFDTSKEMGITISVTDASEDIIPSKKVDDVERACHNAPNNSIDSIKEKTLIISKEGTGEETGHDPNISCPSLDTVEIGEQAVCNTKAALEKRNDEAELRSKGKRKIVETDEVAICNNETTVEESNDETDLDTDELDVCTTQATVEETNDEVNLASKGNIDHGIEESIFIKPTRLHLTVLMLNLWNEERVTAAVDVLQGVKSKLYETLGDHPISVQLKGLACMKGSPKKAHVLYASVEESDDKNRLIQACNIIRAAYVVAGLVSQKEQNQELKLHLTLMNTSNRKRKKGKRYGKRMPFDATEIILKHGSEDWGNHKIVEAQLSQRFVYDDDDYYHCCSTLQFPTS